jgi:hypothetical protein
MSTALIITVYGLFFLLSFSISLFLFIIIRRVVLEKRRARFERLYRQIEKDVLEAISLLNPDFSLRVAHQYKPYPDVLTKVLLDYGEVIAGEGRDQLRVIFNHAVKDRCLISLASRRMIKRLQAARLFIIFFGQAERAFLLRLLDDKPLVKLTVVSALARLPSPETLDYIFKAFEEDTGSTVRSYFNIMFSLGNRIEPPVKAQLKKNLSVEKLGLLIELVGAVPLRSLAEDIVSYASHPDKEIRIKVARALGRLLIPGTVQTLIALAADEAWEVKAQAIKSLGKLRNPDTMDILTKSLFSPHWYVRYNAGYGLAEMGEEGLRRLRAVAVQEEDKFARDMSVMVLSDLISIEAVA